MTACGRKQPVAQVYPQRQVMIGLTLAHYTGQRLTPSLQRNLTKPADAGRPGPPGSSLEGWFVVCFEVRAKLLAARSDLFVYFGKSGRNRRLDRDDIHGVDILVHEQ